MDLDAYARAMGAAQELVPSFDKQRLQQAQLQQTEADTAQRRMLVQKAAAELDDDHLFAAEVEGLSANAGAADYARLMTRHPRRAEILKNAWGTLSADRQRQDLGTFSQLWSALHTDNIPVALGLMQRHKQAREASAGAIDPDDAEVIADLESGDPARIASVKHRVGSMLSTIQGPDKFTSSMNAMERAEADYSLSPGQVRFDYQNNPVTYVPNRSQPMKLRDGDQDTIVEYTPPMNVPGLPSAEGGTRTIATGAPPPAPSVGAGAGGGSDATRGIRNNNPGNLEDTAFTRSQPGYVGSDGRFARFDTPGNGVRAQETLLDRHYWGKGLNTIRGVIGKYAPGSDGNDVTGYANYIAKRVGVSVDTPITEPEKRRAVARAMRTFESRYEEAEVPAIRTLARGKPKPGYRVLTPSEVARVPHLDTSRSWQISPQGRISPVGPKPTGGKERGAPRSPAEVVAPIVQKLADGKAISLGEQQALDIYRRRSTRKAKEESGNQPAASPGGLRPGAVVNGFRFKGGDPKSKASWERAK